MNKVTFEEARTAAIKAGGSDAEINRQADSYLRQVGTVPFNNMITALNLHPWHNGEAEWTRLAAALKARRLSASLNRMKASR